MKKIRFPLEMADGAEVRSLEDLQEHFDLESVLEYYKNGRLLTWLQDRYLESEAAAVAALNEQTPDFQQKLCEIFGVEYTGETVDLEEIARRQERLAKLRTYTDDAEMIGHIDQVAFDQEDLADLLDEDAKEIYLCGDRFTIPASRKGVTYIGINEPKVHISGVVSSSSEDLGIQFLDVEVDNLQGMDFRPSPNQTTQNSSAVEAPTAQITGNMIDEIFKGQNLSLRPCYHPGIQFETANFVVYEKHGLKDEGWKDVQILFDKRTGEKRRLAENFPYISSACTDGDRVFYFKHDENKNSQSEGDIWTVDLSRPSLPQKLFPIDGVNISVYNGHIAYIDNNIGPAVYDMETRTISKIPVPEGSCEALYAVDEGVYFSISNHPTYSMNFYDYASKKAKVLFETKDAIYRIYHIENESLFYVQTDWRCTLLDLSNASTEKVTAAKIYDAMKTDYQGENIYAYRDCLVYVARGGIVKAVDYETGEAKEIASDAYKHHYDSGGLFRKASSWDTPEILNRIGDWVWYNLKGDHGKKVRVSLRNPGAIEFIQTQLDESEDIVVRFEKEKAFGAATYEIPEIEMNA